MIKQLKILPFLSLNKIITSKFFTLMLSNFLVNEERSNEGVNFQAEC